MSRTEDAARRAHVSVPNHNLLTNGNFNFWQRGLTRNLVNGTYMADRFQWLQVGSGVAQAIKHDSAHDGRDGHTLRVSVTTPDTSIAAGDVYLVRQAIEGYDCQILSQGLSGAKTVTLSFKMYSPLSGTCSGALRNSAKDRSYVFEYEAVAGVWTTHSITIDLDQTGTWLIDDGVGLEVIWAMAAGSTFSSSTVGAWQAGNYPASTNQINLMGVAHSIYYTDMKLEMGSVANDYVDEPYSEQLARCQRYYCKSYHTDTTPGTATSSHSTLFTAMRTATQQYMQLDWPVRMRAIPSVSIWDNTGTANRIGGIDSATLVYNGASSAYGNRGFRAFAATAVFTANDRYEIQWTADAEL